MRLLRACVALAAFSLTAGCYHQVVQTGLPPSPTVVTKGFHPTYIFGLVKAAPIDVRQECPNGIALASTRMTFVNGLVGVVTLGLFTPHEVTVTCASAGSAARSSAAVFTVAADATERVFEDVMYTAARAVSHTGGLAIVTFAPATEPATR